MNSYDLITKFRNHLDKAGLIQSGHHVVLAVSGGMDSICLLFLFNELKDEQKYFEKVHVRDRARAAAATLDWVSLTILNPLRILVFSLTFNYVSQYRQLINNQII